MEEKFLPLSVPSFMGKELEYVSDCIKSEWVSTAGSWVNGFEEKIARYVGTKRAVACSSGTSALHTSLLLAGVVPGDEVIVPTVTFIAPVNTVKYAGAEPVFMDCDEFMNIDVEKLEQFCEGECTREGGHLVNRSSGAVVRAVVPVHIFGNPADMTRIMDLSRSYNFKVIEDATESLGSFYSEGPLKGQKTGAVGHLGCYSFNGNKIITTGGGGMIVTQDEGLADRAFYLTNQAKDDAVKYVHDEVGFNYRMTNMQAALGCAQLEKIGDYLSIKRQNHERYEDYVSDIDGLDLVTEPGYGVSNFWYYSLLVDKDIYGRTRDDLIEAFAEAGIQARPLWHLNHLQKPYRRCMAYRIEKASYFSERLLNIPCSINLCPDDMDRIVSVMKDE